VPQAFERLEALPGVGHKIASVVMSQAFGGPALPVDTHIHRLAQRWKLTNARNVEQTERDLKTFSAGAPGSAAFAHHFLRPGAPHRSRLRRHGVRDLRHVVSRSARSADAEMSRR